jgi:Actinobacteria/chloroflexi VLRF1 release factor
VHVKNVPGSGNKWLDVSAERFPGWIVSFGLRHGTGIAGPAALIVNVGQDRAAFTAPDGSVAECYPPFPPSAGLAALGLRDPAAPSPMAVADALAAHAKTPRTVGVLLVRLGGYAVGVFTGYPPVLADSKTGSRLVHGRSAAGGWSQHRFARRREKQANEALAAAADAAVMVFGRQDAQGAEGAQGTQGAQGAKRAKAAPAALDAVVLGGDKRAVAELRDDPRLAPYLARAADRFLTVPDPKRAILEATPRQFTAVRIWLNEAPAQP